MHLTDPSVLKQQEWEEMISHHGFQPSAMEQVLRRNLSLV